MATSAVPAIFPPSSVSIKYFSTRQFCLRWWPFLGTNEPTREPSRWLEAPPRFDLMIMGFKLQLMSVAPRDPEDTEDTEDTPKLDGNVPFGKEFCAFDVFFCGAFLEFFFLRKPNMSFFGWNIFWSCILESHVKGSTHRTLDLWNLVLLETLYCTSWWWQLFTPIDSGKIGGSNSDCIICIFFWIGLVQCSTTNHELW